MARTEQQLADSLGDDPGWDVLVDEVDLFVGADRRRRVETDFPAWTIEQVVRWGQTRGGGRWNPHVAAARHLVWDHTDIAIGQTFGRTVVAFVAVGHAWPDLRPHVVAEVIAQLARRRARDNALDRSATGPAEEDVLVDLERSRDVASGLRAGQDVVVRANGVDYDARVTTVLPARAVVDYTQRNSRSFVGTVPGTAVRAR